MADINFVKKKNKIKINWLTKKANMLLKKKLLAFL